MRIRSKLAREDDPFAAHERLVGVLRSRAAPPPCRPPARPAPAPPGRLSSQPVGALAFGLHEPLFGDEAPRALSKNTGVPSANEKELARLAEKQIADLGTMGLHRLLNDEPKAALVLFEWAAKADPTKYADRVASLRKRLGVRG